MAALDSLLRSFSPADFGDADDAALTARLKAYLKDAEAQADLKGLGEEAFVEARVLMYARSLALDDVMRELQRNPDKFRKEGSLTVDFDVPARIAALTSERDKLARDSGLALKSGPLMGF